MTAWFQFYLHGCTGLKDLFGCMLTIHCWKLRKLCFLYSLIVVLVQSVPKKSLSFGLKFPSRSPVARTKDIPPSEKIGESWELADLPDDKSVIRNGELAGQTLSEANENHTKQITGKEDFVLPFPLLIKFIDAEDILSVQVHPDAETCVRLGKGQPKTECWYIISAAPGAVIYKGLKKGVTREQFAQAIKNAWTQQGMLNALERL